MDLSIGKKLAYAAVAVLSGLALLEGVARVVYPPSPSTFEEHQQLIDVVGLSEINATMIFDPQLFWKLKPDLDRQRVRGSIREFDFDFSITTNGQGLRMADIDPPGEQLRILALGDSCTFGLGVDDEQTWPAQLEAILDERLPAGAQVINAGVPGYTSYQGLRFLETRSAELAPDLVVVTFGFNDADVWSSRSDVETARLMRLREQLAAWEAALQHSQLYQGLSSLARSARAGVSAEGETPRVAPDEFQRNLIAIQELAAARGSATLFVIWPYNRQVQNDAPERIVYQPIIARAARKTAAPVVDLYPAFHAVKARGSDTPFIDHVHASAAGSAAAARAIANAITRRPGIRAE